MSRTVVAQAVSLNLFPPLLKKGVIMFFTDKVFVFLLIDQFNK